jgi:hypothetical protein
MRKLVCTTLLLVAHCSQQEQDAASSSATTTGAAAALLAATAPTELVNRTTLARKFMMGYQGWFATPCDGYGIGWSHWSSHNRTPGPDPDHQGFLRFDSWPDMSEFDDDELCPTNLRYSNGAIAGLYSAANSKTVDRHFRWMASHSIDGVWKQRFLCDVGAPGPKRDFNDRVTANVAAAAAASGRVWALMYDVSGADPDTLLEHVKSDWSHLVSRLKILDGDRYLHHRGAPILAIWGFGHDCHSYSRSLCHVKCDADGWGTDRLERLDA